jgi:hypothetical protein
MNAFNAEGSVSKAIFLADTPSKPVSSGFIRYWTGQVAHLQDRSMWFLTKMMPVKSSQRIAKAIIVVLHIAADGAS